MKVCVEVKPIIDEIINLQGLRANSSSTEEIEIFTEEIDRRLFMLDYILKSTELKDLIRKYIRLSNLYAYHLHSEEDLLELKRFKEELDKQLSEEV